MLKLLAIAVFSTAALNAQASITRCTDASGKVTYQENVNCAEGSKTSAKLSPPPTPSEADRKRSGEQAFQAKKDAERLEKARETQDKKFHTASATDNKKAAAHARKCSGLSLQVKRALEDEKLVKVRGAEARKLKRVRLEEDYSRACGTSRNNNATSPRDASALGR